MLIDIAEGLEKRTSRQLDLFVRLLEPIMLLVMAVVTLIIVAGLLLPVFKMSTAINSSAKRRSISSPTRWLFSG